MGALGVQQQTLERTGRKKDWGRSTRHEGQGGDREALGVQCQAAGVRGGGDWGAE